MPGVVRLTDNCTGHSCYPPRMTVQGSNNVYCNGLNVHRKTDLWAVHCCGSPPSCHTGATVKGSGTVFVNGLPVARMGDDVSCGSKAMGSSRNVFCGD